MRGPSAGSLVSQGRKETVMLRLALLAMLFCTTAHAVTDNPDGSVTMTHEEAKYIADNLEKMEADIQQLQKDRAISLQVLKRMQEEINRLEKGPCI